MGANLDSRRKGSRDVHLNIVPFIDLLSCLTAFLLVTAVWSNVSNVEIEARGVDRDPVSESEDDTVYASIHVTETDIWVGLSRLHVFQRVTRVGDDYDWEALHKVLDEFKSSSYFTDRQDIEIAADDGVSYQNLVSAIDTAVATGFDRVGVTDPAGLSARRQL